MNYSSRFLRIGLLGSILALASCATAPKPRAYSVKVALDPSLVGTSLQVDLIGANQLSDLPKWESYSVTEYWQPDNVMRRGAQKITFHFARSRPEIQVFAADDPRWREWLAAGAQYLVVIADIPGSWADRAGNADGRRVSVPLDLNEWGKGTETLEFSIQRSGIRLMTPKKP